MNISSKSTTNDLAPTGDKYYIWLALFITTLSQTTFSFLALGIGALVPFFISDLEISKVQAGFLVGAVNFGIALTSLLMGILVDRIGEKKVLVAGGILVGITGLIASRVNTFEVLVFIMLIIGCWTASSAPAGSKGIMAWFPLSKRGFAMGFRQIGQPLGGGLAAVILPVLALVYGWRGALLGASLIVIAGAVLVASIYKEKNVDMDVQKKPVQVPIKQNLTKLLGNRDLWMITLTALILTGIQFTVVGYWVLFIHDGLGYSIKFSSYMFSLALLVGIVGRVFWGVISDRAFNSNRKILFVAVVLLTVIMCLSIFFLSAGAPKWILVVLSCLAGFTTMGWHGLFILTVSELAGVELAGTAIGIAVTVAHTGALIIQPFFGFLVDMTDSYFIGWLVLAIIALVGVALIGNIQGKEQENANQSFPT